MPNYVLCNQVLTQWKPSLDFQGSLNMVYYKNLLASRPFQNLVPDFSHHVVTSGYGTYGGAEYVTTASLPDGTLSISYLPSHHVLSVDMSKFSASVLARWYDPTNGTYSSIGTFANNGSKQFSSPASNSEGFADWVLVLEAP
jgi:hypothetical protein